MNTPGPGINPRTEELLEQLFIQKTEGGAAPGAEFGPELLAQAARAGYLETRHGEYTLTDSGAAAGRDVVRRHRLAEHLLHSVLAVGAEGLNEDACEFEHVLRHGLDDKICTLLGHPTRCPHGNLIPEGECCRRARQDQIREVQPLCDGKANQEGTVAYLSTRDSRDIQKLMALGILPGTPIRLVRRYPSYVFEVGYSQFTVDRSLAEKIYVHWGLTPPGSGPRGE